jgi:hypothetical protein
MAFASPILGKMFVASCPELQAGSLRSPSKNLAPRRL